MKKWRENEPEVIKKLRPQLDAFVQSHPNYPDAYAVRALVDACYLRSRNYESVLADINRAILTRPPEEGRAFNVVDLLAYRARIDFESGRYREALEDLEAAMKKKVDDSNKIFNSGDTKPDTASAPCTWSLSDIDLLAQKFPKDYRSSLFRGLFLSFFTTFDEKYFQQAIQEFQKAATLNPRSPLPHYFMGEIYVESAFWTKAAQLTAIAQTHLKAAGEYTDAIRLDTKFVQAYAGRANVYFQLKRSHEAIKDYDRVLELDPDNESVYNDRALAKTDVLDYYSAISDFGESIRRKKPGSWLLGLTYENRADAYMNVHDYSHAIADLDKAIELGLANFSLLMSLRQLRAIYPEYNSDEALCSKVQRLFLPELTYDEVFKRLGGNKDLISEMLANLFVKRGEAYLKISDYKRAATEYNRAVLGFGDYGKSIDRWRHVGSSSAGEHFLDVRTLEVSPDGSARLWFKTVDKKGGYTVNAYQIDCGTKRINQGSTTTYNGKGAVMSSSEISSGYQQIVPDSIGEGLYNGVCSEPVPRR